MMRKALGRRFPFLGHAQARWCGIVACLDYDGHTARTSSTALARACNKISHRGPDGHGIMRGTFRADSHVQWAIGHTRLAIIAPNEDVAAQPFRSEDLSFAANGEIYLHRELHAQLQRDGYSRRLASHSDCEVIGHLYRHYGPHDTLQKLEHAGMFAFALVDEAKGQLFAARDPNGIKPLYYGRDAMGRIVVLASELKALVELPGVCEVAEFPAGHYLYDGHIHKYYSPAWQRYFADNHHLPPSDLLTDPHEARHAVREALDCAVEKRMMTDVPFGLFLSGGIDSCIVGQLMLARCAGQHIPSFTVGMAGSPDLMAARAMARELKTVHHERIFTAEEAIAVVDKVVYHMETYNAELIRSAIPNYFLAELAASQVKMVLTGEGADELWAGYAYFRDAPSPSHLHRELVRIYSYLGFANLLRTDRMTMAHSLEARVPFLDVHNTASAMSVHPILKLPDPNRNPGEKAFLRLAFQDDHRGITIPSELLWRPKAMQAEGVGIDWVHTLQSALGDRVSDAQFADAPNRFPYETPQSKEEYYYRHIFDLHYPKCHHVPTLWPGGCRAGGAEWQSDTYTRFGLSDGNRLKHAYM